ncbi:hypothetical protein AB1N83_011704 [Pleurotus pulmonarius]
MRPLSSPFPGLEPLSVERRHIELVEMRTSIESRNHHDPQRHAITPPSSNHDSPPHAPTDLHPSIFTFHGPQPRHPSMRQSCRPLSVARHPSRAQIQRSNVPTNTMTSQGSVGDR